jgi:hypothetical protein
MCITRNTVFCINSEDSRVSMQLVNLVSRDKFIESCYHEQGSMIIANADESVKIDIEFMHVV